MVIQHTILVNKKRFVFIENSILVNTSGFLSLRRRAIEGHLVHSIGRSSNCK